MAELLKPSKSFCGGSTGSIDRVHLGENPLRGDSVFIDGFF